MIVLISLIMIAVGIYMQYSTGSYWWALLTMLGGAILQAM